MGTAVARTRSKRTRAETEAEIVRVYELYVAGAEPVHIARELGISRATVYRRIDAGRKLRLDPLVDEYRHDAITRVNEARRRIYATLERTQPLVNALTGTVVHDDDGELQPRLLQDPQELRLTRTAHVPYFIEKQCSTTRQFKLPLPRFPGIGKRSLFVTE